MVLLPWFYSIVFADVFLSSKIRHFVEAYPCLSILDVLQLLHDLFLRNAVALGNHPELHELLAGDLAVPVKVNLIEEFPSRQLAKWALPVLQGLVAVYFVAAVNVKYFESSEDLILTLLAELL